MWLIGTLMNCIDGSMPQKQHCDVIDTSGAPHVIPGLNRIDGSRSIHRPFDNARADRHSAEHVTSRPRAGPLADLPSRPAGPPTFSSQGRFDVVSLGASKLLPPR